MNRREFLAFGLGGTGILADGCRRRPVSRKRLVRVSTLPKISMSGLYLAGESGYFSDAGLQLEFVQMAGGALMLPPLSGGRIDVGFMAATPALINAVAGGARARIVAGREIASPHCGYAGTLYARRELFPRGVTDLRKLKGKVVAVEGRTAFSGFCLDTMLGSVGLGAEDVRLTTMRQPDAAAALLAGNVDAIVSSNFEKDLGALSKNVVRGPSMGQIHPNHQYSFVAFGPTLLDRDREAGVRFLSAYLRGSREFLQGRTPHYLEELARASRMDPEVVRKACRETFTPDGSIDKPSLERLVAWAVGKKFCPKRVDVAQMIDTGFLEEAQRRLGWRSPGAAPFDAACGRPEAGGAA